MKISNIVAIITSIWAIIIAWIALYSWEINYNNFRDTANEEAEIIDNNLDSINK